MSRATLSPPWTTYQQTIHLFTQCPRSRLLSQPWSPSFTNNHTAPRPGIYTLRSRNHTTAVISGYRQPLKQQDTTRNQARHASSSSSSRWKTRQSNDGFARGAKVAGLKSRAAFKLLELDGKHRLFRAGNTVVDLGYAPGSWSQVAVNRTSPGGRVVGIDVIPAQPPRGASSIQGNFLSAEVREEVRRYVKDSNRGRARVRGLMGRKEMEDGGNGVSESEMVDMERGIVDLGIHADEHDADAVTNETAEKRKSLTRIELDEAEGHVVDVVLSDMSAPWEQTTGMWIKSVSNPYFRMMNTSGMPFRDHAGSMDLCLAALTFCYDTLRTGGHFLCKFYQGGEDKAFEMQLKKLFEKVYREKPESSRSESKEAYFVALRRKPDVDRALIFPEDG